MSWKPAGIAFFLASLCGAQPVMADAEVCAEGRKPMIFDSANRTGQAQPVRGFFLPAAAAEGAAVVILLPTSLGIEPPDCYSGKQREFRARGYASVVLDSYNETGLQDGRKIEASLYDILRDAQAAARHFRSRDGTRKVFVAGWSRGAAAALKLATAQGEEEALFDGAVAYYPSCPLSVATVNMPFLVIHGDGDRTTSSAACQAMRIKGNGGDRLEVTVLPGARHRFDFPDTPYYSAGQRQSAAQRMFRFLDARSGSGD